MTKKHFEAIAEAIKLRLWKAEEEMESIGVVVGAGGINSNWAEARGRALAVRELAEDLAETFGQFNHNFDAERFLEACGISDEDGA